MKKQGPEEQIHAQIRELTGKIRQLREELSDGDQPKKKAAAHDVPSRRRVSKKR